jgi:glycosyltransferase involved in cell wall biosynthesis
VLPAHNAETTLRAALASVARQILTSWECIIVDDGSTDGTQRVASEAARSDSRFRVFSIPQAGLVAALNEGLRCARGAYIARMDADDLMHRDRLGIQACALERDASLAAVGCHVRLFPRTRLSPRLCEYESWLNGLNTAEDVRRDAFVECPVAHPALMMRRSMAELRYTDNGWPEDYDLILRALAAGQRIGVVPRRLLSWRDREERLSRTDARYALDRFTACKAHYLSTGLLARQDRYVLWGYGGTGRSLRRALAALGRIPSHIVEVKATQIGQQIHGAPVIRPDALRLLNGPIVVSVARQNPRTEIRTALDAMGFVEGEDYVCAA